MTEEHNGNFDTDPETQKETGQIEAESSEQAELTKAQMLLQRLLLSHETWYDVERNYAFAGRTFPGFAAFHSYGEQYVLSKRAKLWEADQHEYIFFDIVDRLEEEAFCSWVEFLKQDAINLVEAVPDHMSTNISLVLIADSVSPEAKKAIKRAKYRKNFMFGIRGWSDMCIAVCDLSSGENGQVISNAAGKGLAQAVIANLKPKAQ